MTDVFGPLRTNVDDSVGACMRDSGNRTQQIRLGVAVVALEDIGGVWNPAIREGTTGWVIEQTADGGLLVEFEGHRSQVVAPVRLRPVAVRSPTDARGRGWLRRRQVPA